MPHSLIAEELWHSDKTVINQEGTTLHGLDPLMDTASRRIGNSTTFPEVSPHLPPIVNRNFPPVFPPGTRAFIIDARNWLMPPS
jgi:hypothetical protein